MSLVRKTLAMLPAVLAMQATYADDIIFDTGALKTQGLDTSLATQFQRGDAFPPGINRVSLKVNGVDRGRHPVWFDKAGRVCPDASLLRQGGLRVPPGVPDRSGEDAATEAPSCPDLTAVWPQFTVEARPGEGTLALIVPQEALDPDADSAHWQHNGAAAMLNYGTQYMGSQTTGSRMNYWQVQTEAGFNAGDWVVRSNQSLYHFGDSTQTDYQNAYAQRTFTGLKSTLQVGQIPLTGGLFGIGQVIGFQMTPEQGLYAGAGAAVVTGIADGPSVVEIRQLGVPVFHTTVPAGPFNLSGFSLLNTRSDLTVLLKGTDGSERSFIVPASAYAREGATITPGVSWGVGRYDQQGANKHPLVAVASKGFQLSERTALQGGVLWGGDYQAVSTALNTTFLWRTGVSLQNTFSRAAAHSENGSLTSLTVSQPLGDAFTLNLNGSHQDKGYREFSEAQIREPENISRNQDQIGGGFTWSQEWLGSVSLSAGRSTQTRGDATTWTQLSWGRQFGRATVNVNASRNESGGGYGREDRLYISLQFPLGESMTMNTTMNHGRDGWRYGSRVDQRLSQDRNWSLSVERDENRRQNSATGTFSSVTRWSNLTGSVSADSDHSRSLSIQTSGSVVAHGHGVTMAPYQVRDTFAIAKVGNKSGVRLETPAGPVWTDNNGFAVIPSLNSWARTGVEVDTRSLGKRADVLNGMQEVSPARGSVSHLRFDMVSTRRVMVSMRGAGGQRLPSGAAVYDAKGEFITVVDEDGNVFLPDARPGMTFSVDTKKNECRVTLDRLPEEPAEEAGLYETISGVCR
ncbi:fimbria/pilus outer membrane usher protein [Klebsiella aerogenes]|uniref:fimbria/pilus outer membrane usher protein n=1 Tax=Klebsiella aerogenes TaxID=548 RepID=UPI0009D66B51|nr:fimbria/pilus outer membrane usher protein [Klebsiella aerogenes]